jgi:drug/metabolite transporter (DMT)-like permease
MKAVAWGAALALSIILLKVSLDGATRLATAMDDESFAFGLAHALLPLGAAAAAWVILIRRGRRSELPTREELEREERAWALLAIAFLIAAFTALALGERAVIALTVSAIALAPVLLAYILTS